MRFSLMAHVSAFILMIMTATVSIAGELSINILYSGETLGTLYPVKQ